MLIDSISQSNLPPSQFNSDAPPLTPSRFKNHPKLPTTPSSTHLNLINNSVSSPSHLISNHSRSLSLTAPSNSVNSPRNSFLLSRPPSPIPRDDIIEGMSASTSSIFERDVEHFVPTLTAHEAIQLAIPPVLDEAFQVLATTDPAHILVDQLPLQAHLSSPLPLHKTLPNPSQTPTPPAPPTSLPNSPLLPALHRHCASDSATLSDPSSPRSLSPTPSLRRPLGSGLPDPPVRPRKTCLSFMSYADVINAERAEDYEPNVSALARFRMARKSSQSLGNRTPTGPTHHQQEIGRGWIGNLTAKSRAWKENNTGQSRHRDYEKRTNRARGPGQEEESEVLSDLEWNSC